MRNYFDEYNSNLRNGMALGQALGDGLRMRQQRERQAAIDEQNAYTQGLQNTMLENQLAAQQKQDRIKELTQDTAALFSANTPELRNALSAQLATKYKSEPMITEQLGALQGMDMQQQDAALLRQLAVLNGDINALMPKQGQAAKINGVDPNAYTPESVQAYSQTGDFRALVPRQTTSDQLKAQELTLKVAERKEAATQAEKDKETKQRAALYENENALYKVQTLLSNPDGLDSIYGKYDALKPDWALSQNAVDLKANIQTISSTLELAAAGKLKGQGTVTESERATLREVASNLKNYSMSAEQARKELLRVAPIFENELIRLDPENGLIGKLDYNAIANPPPVVSNVTQTRAKGAAPQPMTRDQRRNRRKTDNVTDNAFDDAMRKYGGN
jgi:hypothetical protein